MMAPAAGRPAALIDRLPPARGRLTANAAIGPMTWFRVGGPAEVLFRPSDAEDLAAFLAALPDDVPVTVIGVGSNLLVRDGAGALDLNVALTAAEAGIANLEFLSGVPGTIGGGLRMNAGAYGGEIKDVLVDAEAVDRRGAFHRASAAELDLSYRHSGAPGDWIFIGAVLRGRPGDPAEIGRRMEEIKTAREASQPIRMRTGGSTFANPAGDHAWRLIDEAGCRGLTRGGAMVSEKHANFLINTGAASAADIEGLGEEVRRRVGARFGVVLDWEIRRVGSHAGEPARA
jgi:UDP-N-acetylmuramate dehydrogenase